jgi:signal transduction histidine kinase
MTPLSLQLQSFRHLLEQGSLNQVAPDRLKRMLDTSYQQVERLTALIDDLLDLSRITAGRLSLSPEDTDLKLIVESVLEAFHEEITKSGAGVELFSPPQVLGHWDRARLEQVVINLLSNALKYGPRKPIHIRLSHAPEKARLEVRDFGIGIDPHDQLRIFQRFERAVSSDNYGGLGLGLYITSEIVGLHRGKIWVESVPGSGSNFIVELPLRA